MKQEDRDYCERLLAAQSQDPDLKTKYQREVRAMLEHKLPASNRWLLAAIVALILVATVVTAITLARVASDDDMTREWLIVALVFELAIAGCLGRIAWRGILDHLSGFAMAFVLGNFAMLAAGFLNEQLVSVAPAEIRTKIGWIPIVIVIIGWLPTVLVINSHYHERTREK